MNSYTRDLLHQKPVFTSGFYTIFISPEDTYTWNLSQAACTLYTKGLWTPEKLLQEKPFATTAQIFLHRTTFTLEALYTKEFSLQKAFTQTPLHQTIFAPETV